jgi:hypothetical protein
MNSRQGPIAKICATNSSTPQKQMKFVGGNIKTFEIRNAHEVADLKTLTEQDESSAIKTERFKALTILSQKNEQISLKELLLHAFSNDHRQLCKPRPHIDEFIEDKNPMSWTE